VIGGVAVAKLGEHWPLFMGLIFFAIIVLEPGGIVGILARIRRGWFAANERKELLGEGRHSK
jgi:hypothetical protein